jgi:hypothetical protein
VSNIGNHYLSFGIKKLVILVVGVIKMSAPAAMACFNKKPPEPPQTATFLMGLGKGGVPYHMRAHFIFYMKQERFLVCGHRQFANHSTPYLLVLVG